MFIPCFSFGLHKLTLLVILMALAGCESSFTDSGQSLGSYDSRSLALGDVDGDNDLDMAVANLNQGNRVYLNGNPLKLSGKTSGDLSAVIRKATALKLGSGYGDDDPAYHTLFDEFRFFGEIKTSFDLGRSLLAQP